MVKRVRNMYTLQIYLLVSFEAVFNSTWPEKKFVNNEFSQIIFTADVTTDQLLLLYELLFILANGLNYFLNTSPKRFFLYIIQCYTCIKIYCM